MFRLIHSVPLVFLALSACQSGVPEEPKLSNQPSARVAEAALKGGNPQLALQLAEGVLANHPVDADALLVRADAQFALGRPDVAAANYQRVLQISPSSIHAQVGLGRTKLESDPAQAEGLFTRALGNDPRNVAALNDLGVARDLQGRHADAQDAYRRALALGPDNNATLVNLGLSLAQSGNKPGALQVLQPLASRGVTNDRVKQNLAAALTAAGDPAGAQRVLGSAVMPGTSMPAVQ